MAQTTEKPTKKERKKARKDLAALLRRLQRGCNTMDKVSEWYDMARDVEAVVNDNAHAIPADQRRRMLEALKLPEATLAGAGKACDVLQAEIGKTIVTVGGATAVGGASAGGGAALTAAVTVVLLTAVVAAVVVVATNLSAVDVRITNRGCGPFDVAQAPFANSALLSLAGLSLPSEAIASGGSGIVTIPPLPLEVDNATDPDTLSIRGLGLVEIPVPVGGATDIRFNGQSLLGARRTINLTGRDEHVLEVICGE